MGKRTLAALALPYLVRAGCGTTPQRRTSHTPHHAYFFFFFQLYFSSYM